MTLRTVRVPDAIAAPFAEAEEVVSRYFRLRKDDAEHGSIEIAGERYVLVRAASLSVEFFALVQDLYGPGREKEADEFARNILFDLAHAIGRSDAQNFHSRMDLTEPIARLSAGPVHFAHAGWAFVDIDPSSRPSADGDFYLLFEHPYSFEADAWLRAGKRRDFAACIMNAGYSSGWCEESFGVELVSAEVLCRAKGDPCCRFIMAHPHRIEERLREYVTKDGATSDRSAARAYQIPDFFARKRMEEELRQARDALELRVVERTAELRRSNERLRAEMEERKRVEEQLLQTRKLEAIGRLAGGIAHDFNNLIAVVIGNAGLLAKHIPEGERTRAYVDEIAAAGARAAELTRQLLAFSRAQALAPEVIEITPVVSNVVRMLRRVIGEEIALATSLRDDAGFVEADRGKLEQVVMNLVVNARDAMPDGGTLSIRTERTTLDDARAKILDTQPGEYVRLSVADTGTGMDADVRAHVFDPFFTTKADRGGTGLGLSTVYGIVRQSGGAVDVASTPGSGSRFDVYLPSVALPTRPAAGAPAPIAVRGTETVLLAEDQEPLRRLIAKALGEIGYAVLEGSDAPDALRIAREHPGTIDLLLADVVMPRLRGPELARRVREVRPSIRVLLMSGYVDSLDTGSAGEDLAAEHLAKPFTIDALARRVRDVLDAAGAVPSGYETKSGVVRPPGGAPR
jgi:signal transduction histidine kinase/CheY-like chemotaxis protein